MIPSSGSVASVEEPRDERPHFCSGGSFWSLPPVVVAGLHLLFGLADGGYQRLQERIAVPLQPLLKP